MATPLLDSRGHLSPGYLIPELESVRPFPAVHVCRQAMPPGTEVFLNRPEGGEEAVGMAG